MQLSGYNKRCYCPQEMLHRSPKALNSFARRGITFLRQPPSPLMIVLLVRGLIFLAASVILVYAQDADSTSRHQPVIAGTGKADLRAPATIMKPFVAERKIEVVEIFSTGEECYPANSRGNKRSFASCGGCAPPREKVVWCG
jgi:hypothetical protein